MKTGVYQIRNLLNGKLYVGSVSHKKGFADRWSKHRTTLRHKKHFNQHLQCAWNKYGKEAFEFSILEEVMPKHCIEREQYYLDILNPEYNIRRCAKSNLGIKWTEESKQKLSNSRRGMKFSQEHKDNLSKANAGRKLTDEHRQNISNGLQGRTVTTKTRAKISIAQQGELGNNTKLTVVDVCKIKILLQQKESQRNIAKLFGVGQQTISNINMGQTWSHI